MRSNTNGIRIRAAVPGDAAALRCIYAPYVENTAITFEYKVPSVEEFAGRIRHTLQKYPYLVAEKGGKTLGYAYASPFKERAAYDWAVETSIYVDGACQKMGLGRKLHDALAQVLTLQGVCNMEACIACPDGADDEYLTHNSEQFHAHLGYRLVGEFRQCGYKFDRWYNMVWMEKHLAPHVVPQPPIRPFDEVRAEAREQYGIL